MNVSDLMHKGTDAAKYGSQTINNTEEAAALANTIKQTQAMSNVSTLLNFELQKTLTVNNQMDKCASAVKEQVQNQR
ncbi:hypothetical protein KQH60_09980 [Mycetohabitans sp. B8]|uniref:hypothetical protein n=1 Tax=Mycetohabitans sp. B8 TaxID=2841845 RepID=UPI001F228353|nr:hypothetical protein [Mycetohabitans sp. B8]MCG1042846.1 hypothetical protein [Mycetohabitans sp. B8]